VFSNAAHKRSINLDGQHSLNLLPLTLAAIHSSTVQRIQKYSNKHNNGTGCRWCQRPAPSAHHEATCRTTGWLQHCLKLAAAAAAPCSHAFIAKMNHRHHNRHNVTTGHVSAPVVCSTPLGWPVAAAACSNAASRSYYPQHKTTTFLHICQGLMFRVWC
jgi:hypothetical protein